MLLAAGARMMGETTQLTSWWKVVYVAFVHDATGDVIEAIDAPGVKSAADEDAIALGKAMVAKNSIGQIDSLKQGRWRAVKMPADASGAPDPLLDPLLAPAPGGARDDDALGPGAVSYTHLTLPTKA